MILRIEGEDYFLIKKVIIGDHVVLGGNAILAPGGILSIFWNVYLGSLLIEYSNELVTRISLWSEISSTNLLDEFT